MTDYRERVFDTIRMSIIPVVRYSYASYCFDKLDHLNFAYIMHYNERCSPGIRWLVIF